MRTGIPAFFLLILMIATPPPAEGASKEGLVAQVESEISRMKAAIGRNPMADRDLLKEKAYPAAEALQKLYAASPAFGRSDAMIVTGLIRDLLRVDPNYYGDPARTFFPLSTRPAFVALFKECRQDFGHALPSQRGLPGSIAPVSPGDVCAVKFLFQNIAYERKHGNG